MGKEDCIKLSGKVIEANPGAKFKVEVNNGHKVNCVVSGKIRLNNIQIIIGDNVDIELSPYDLYNGRIVYRHK